MSDTVAAEQASASGQRFPPSPSSIADTGLSLNFLLGLLLKTMYVTGHETGTQLREDILLPGTIVRDLLQSAADKNLVEILGRAGEGALAELRYALTGLGRDWANEALAQSQYIGPAPVTLGDYHDQVERQLLEEERIGFKTLAKCFDDLVLPEGFVSLIGPAVNAARAILFYGPPGNGKTSIAMGIPKAFRQSVYVPYCLEVDNQIIKVFDTTVHTEFEAPDREAAPDRDSELASKGMIDRRWVRCHRPAILTGGELTLEMLDLNFNPYSRFYEAPMQMKATGGIFVIDDFGRQMVSPTEVLNRWIIPLERRIDYLTLHTGKKFPVPFDELVVFSTNIYPKELMDAATMRRIQYKVEISGPTREDYEDIFRAECENHGVAMPADILTYLHEQFYNKENVPLARYHPAWIVGQVVARCEYEGVQPRLDKRLVTDALRNLYTAY
jgi:hypothetical protein